MFIDVLNLLYKSIVTDILPGILFCYYYTAGENSLSANSAMI